MKKITFLLVVMASLSIGFAQQLTFIDFGSTATGYTSDGNWNNIATANAGSTAGLTANLIDSNGVSTGVTLTINDEFDTVNTAGTSSPDTSLPFPSTATRDSFFGETVTFNGKLEATGGFILTGLDTASYYSFSVFAARSGVSDNREALYTITGSSTKTGSLNASNNTANTAEILNVLPNASGEITFTAQPGTNNNNSSGFYYLGAIQMTKSSNQLSTKALELTNSLSVYPNPVSNTCSISFKLNGKSQVALTIYDLTGKSLSTIYNEKVSTNNFHYTWNRSNEMATGIYILEINVDGTKLNKKLILN
ncbi:T9SS type A sorting domain-containing protein [Mariniflexile aquimaris]|uniref:T9SS type A sorting domain-containing protein n=1 Tax=Mariniflexile aquimaris TaxID=881009 RepID=A0ABW3BTC6_9FLAO